MLPHSNHYMWNYDIPQVVSNQLNTLKAQVSMMVFMGFVVGKVAMGQVSFTVLFSFPLPIIMLQMLCTHLSSGAGPICHIITPLLQLTCNSVAAPTTQWIGYLPACLYLKHLQYWTIDFQHPIQSWDKIIFNYKYVITEL